MIIPAESLAYSGNLLLTGIVTSIGANNYAGFYGILVSKSAPKKVALEVQKVALAAISGALKKVALAVISGVLKKVALAGIWGAKK